MSMTSAGGDTVSKSDFAKLCNVSAGRVSQWIAEGKISGAAIVGEGQRARINLLVAQDQLKSRLDVNQRFGLNGLGTRLDTPALTPVLDLPLQAPASQPVQAAPIVPTNTIDDRIKAEKLRQSEITSRQMAEDELARQGRFVLADDVQREMNVLADQMMSQFHGSLSDLANAVAAKFGLVSRDVLHTLRTALRETRSATAHALGTEIASMPTTTEHALDDASA